MVIGSGFITAKSLKVMVDKSREQSRKTLLCSSSKIVGHKAEFTDISHQGHPLTGSTFSTN